VKPKRFKAWAVELKNGHLATWYSIATPALYKTLEGAQDHLTVAKRPSLKAIRRVTVTITEVKK